MQDKVDTNSQQHFDVWNKDGGCYIFGYDGLKKPNFVVPSIVDGQKIVGISDGAFKNQQEKFDFLQSLEINEGIEILEDEAFCRCTNLSQVKLPSTLKYFGSKNNLFFDIVYGIFGWTAIEQIDLPQDLIHIAKRAFACCRQLKQIALPDDIQIIEEETFFGCHNLQQVLLPKNLKQIDVDAFYGCSSLKEVTIPFGTTTIKNGAFRNCGLQKLYIPATVTDIDPNAQETFGNYGTNKIDVCFCCEKGSYAMEYAKKHKIKFEII